MGLQDLPDELWPIPHTTVRDCVLLHEFIRRAKPSRTLELGVSRGKASCFIGDALRDNGGGRHLGLDMDVVKRFYPTPFDTVKMCGLEDRVEIIASRYSYTWAMIDMLEEALVNGVYQPCFDFVFIDGAHTWAADGFAFFLVNKLLRPGGWLLFDDLGWRQGSGHVPARKHGRDGDPNVAQVDLVWELLAQTDSAYGESLVEGRWGWLQKIPLGGEHDSTQTATTATIQEVYKWVDSDLDTVELINSRKRIRRTIGHMVRYAWSEFRLRPRYAANKMIQRIVRTLKAGRH